LNVVKATALVKCKLWHFSQWF